MDIKQSKNERITELSCKLLEMSADSMIDVPIDPRIDITTITSDDPDPKFVNVEVIRAGISKENNRRYNNNIVREIHELVPGCQGFFGHPDPAKHGFEFREPQTIFVGSMIDHMPDGLDRCIAKAYIFKSSDLREWIPKSIAAGNPMTVSINGVGDIMRNGDIIDVIHMSELQSIDWANPGTEGMGTSTAMSVVKEMKDKEESIMAEPINVKDVIKGITVTELRAYNPDGYNAVLQSATVQELRQANPALVEGIENGVKVTELSLKIGGKDENVKITELQAKISAYEEKISTLENDIAEAKITEFKNKKLVELVPENMRDKIGSRVTGSTEKEIEDSINAEIGYIREMCGSTFDNPPAGRSEQKHDDGIRDAVGRLFGHRKEDN